MSYRIWNKDSGKEFETHGVRAPSRQNRSWVQAKMRQKQYLAVVKHLMAQHDVESCQCGFKTQELVDWIDWSTIKGERHYYYQTAAREYPRFMKTRPELDHRAYTRCVIRTRDAGAILLHFAAHSGRLPEQEIEDLLEKRVEQISSSGGFGASPLSISERFCLTLAQRKKAGKSEQVQAFLRAFDKATLILEVHGQ